MCTKFYLGNVMGTDSQHRPEDNTEMNLKHICFSMWTVFISLMIGSSSELCEHGTDPSEYLLLASQRPCSTESEVNYLHSLFHYLLLISE